MEGDIGGASHGSMGGSCSAESVRFYHPPSQEVDELIKRQKAALNREFEKIHFQQ